MSPRTNEQSAREARTAFPWARQQGRGRPAEYRRASRKDARKMRAQENNFSLRVLTASLSLAVKTSRKRDP